VVPRLVTGVVTPGRLSRHPQPGFRVDELTLRPFVDADAPALIEVYSDPVVQRWHARSMTGDEARDWILSGRAGWAAETSANWAVVADDGLLLGRIGLNGIDLYEGGAEVGYWTTPAARGRAIAPRALDVVSSWLFSEVGLHRLEVRHGVANTASCRVADKAGYRYEGTLRQQALHPDGWHDMHVHGRLAADGTP
jgi:ribosomal-protein-alanine N-acetyltransferase